jgi:hypothetical protein
MFAPDQKSKLSKRLYCALVHSVSEAMTAELQIKKYHIFVEDHRQPAFGCGRDDSGVFCLKLHRLRLSIYGRKFHQNWK